MKTQFRKLLLVLLLLLAGSTLWAQQITIFFYAPTTAMTTNFTGATAPYVRTANCSGNNTGYSYVLLDAQTAPIFRAMTSGTLIRKTYDSLTSASSVLRRRLLQVRELSNNMVNNIQIYLYDDRTGLNPSETCACDETYGTIRGVWPCATNFRQADGTYLGYMYLGELAAQLITTYPGSGGWWEWYATVVHEFSHTQFATEYDGSGNAVANKWGNNGLAISYGGDSGHWGDEIQADQQSALDEGLATFWGLERNTVGRQALINWMNDKTERMYLGSHSFLAGTADMWNRPHRVAFSGTIPANRVISATAKGDITLVSPHIQTGAGYELRSYKWLNVPQEYALYNEQIFQAFALALFENSFPNRTLAFDAMLRSAKALTPPNNRLRYPAHLANAMANELEAFARTPAGRTAEASHTLVSSMFVYAMLDLITHFGMSEADLRREFTINMSTYTPTPQPLAFAQYWAHRAAIKQLACPHLGGPNCTGDGNIDFLRAVSEVKNYFTDSSRILR
jgi:hypothetical protein